MHLLHYRLYYPRLCDLANSNSSSALAQVASLTIYRLPLFFPVIISAGPRRLNNTELPLFFPVIISAGPRRLNNTELPLFFPADFFVCCLCLCWVQTMRPLLSRRDLRVRYMA